VGIARPQRGIDDCAHIEAKPGDRGRGFSHRCVFSEAG
jgi:hypothetical protein